MSNQTLDDILEKIRDLASTCGYDGRIPTVEEMKEIEALIRQEQLSLLKRLLPKGKVYDDPGIRRAIESEIEKLEAQK